MSMCICGLREAMARSGFCAPCEKTFGSEAWERVGAAPASVRARTRGRPPARPRVEEMVEVLELEAAAADPMADAETFTDGEVPVEGDLRPNEEEAGMAPTTSASPPDAGKPRPMVLADLQEEQRAAVKRWFQSRLTTGAPTSAQIATIRDEVEADLGLRIHGASLRLLLDQVRGEVAAAMEAAAPPSSNLPAPAAEVVEPADAGAEAMVHASADDPSSWLIVESTARGTRLRLDVEVPLRLGGMLAYAITRIVGTHGGILPPMAAEVIRG